MSSNKKKPKARSQLMEKGSRWSSARGSRKTMYRRPIKGNIEIFLNGLVFHNPVTTDALDLFPVVGAGYTIQDAAVFSLMMLTMILPMCVLSGWMRAPVWIRPAAALMLSEVMYLPTTALTKWLMPQTFSALSIYTVLMIGSSIILSRTNDHAPPRIMLAVLMDSLGCTAGFSAMIFLVAVLRGIWGNTVKDTDGVCHVGTCPLVGLLLLGVIVALIQHTNAKQAVAEKKAEQEWKWQCSCFSARFWH